ncbi:MAG: PqiC family protein [Alcaligenaceae bacterium]
MKTFLLVVLVALLAGCSTPSPHYYTLSPEGTRAAAPSGQRVVAYALSPVTVPPEVDNSALVTREPNGRLLPLSDDRWTATLSSHLQSALGLELTASLGMPPVQNINQTVTQSDATQIQVDVQRFELVPGQYVALDALWRLRFGQSGLVLTCFSRFKQNVEVGVTALVLGQQKNTQLLSAQIAQALVSRSAPAEVQCTQSKRQG